MIVILGVRAYLLGRRHTILYLSLTLIDLVILFNYYSSENVYNIQFSVLLLFSIRCVFIFCVGPGDNLVNRTHTLARSTIITGSIESIRKKALRDSIEINREIKNKR